MVAERGRGRAATILPIACTASEAATVSAMLDEIVATERVVSARLLETDSDGSSLGTTEKSMRSGDRSFEALLLIEALDDVGLRASTGVLRNGLRIGDKDDAYDQVFALERSDLRPVTRPL